MMIHTSNKKLITKRDAVIILIILAAGFLIYMLFGTFSASGTKAVISVDGETRTTIDLSDKNKTESFELENAVIEIQDCKIRVVSSDCPDKICVNTGYISKKGERIVCLPKKLIIEIEG